MNQAFQAKLKTLPRTPGVYFHKSASGEVIYVGKAAVLKNRVRQYFQDSRGRDNKTMALVAEIFDTDWIETESEVDALFLESEMIKRYMPRYNVLLRDDKSQMYDKKIFYDQELRGRVGVDALKSEKSLYDLVVVDSLGTEMEFAKELENHEEVEVYTKLPRSFYINTPAGRYNPDWAIVFRKGTVKHVYFVAETKGSESMLQLREIERIKIECARKHFDAISGGKLKFDIVTSYTSLCNKAEKK